ncbi:MAG: DegT/DnrJ/EryC1/StrS aminotransferase family protein [Candidatus Omnitrophica bacterium]|nr:DegT/DnrJ/EryC1/StrS aminotransferase family protein [Candidatus Omnitrophota bacterium]
MKKPLFAPWPSFDREIVDAVEEVLVSGKVSQWTGPHVYAFEKEYAAYLGVKHAIAMANGSVTLDTALKVLGIGRGDEVVVASRSFVASASCVPLAGAVPVFADVDPQNGNLTAETIAAVLTKKTKAVIVVHLAGWPCKMDDIAALCRAKKLFLIEDCAQAHGARYKGKSVGTFGDFGSFSFCQDKILTTGGEGGLLVTDDAMLWEKAWSLKDHGRDLAVVFRQKKGTGFKWTVNSFGTNYRMTEMQAAIGRIMLRRLDKMVRARRERAAMLNSAFGKMSGLTVTLPPKECYHAYYKYYVLADIKALKSSWTRDKILKELFLRGISCGIGACPEIYREKAFQTYRKKMHFPSYRRLPGAKKWGEVALMFQVHPTLKMENMAYIIDSMRIILRKAVR